MVTRNNVYTPLSECWQGIKICIWFPRHVFKNMVFVFRFAFFEQVKLY